MKAIIFSLLVSIALFSCNESDSRKAEKEKDSYEATKETLQQKETKDPQSFLSVSGHDRHNLLGQTVVKGTITNKATVASYKDVDVKLDFYSKTGTLLETDKETVYEIIAPGQSKNFKTKYFAPKGTDSVALTVTAAKIADK
ncbi:MAG TPA: FxLYD domain-containing protein [Chitinophagaceae bacterium]|nr:FxLYD domain-containing protein [Chitinophagaceae bacterium]